MSYQFFTRFRCDTLACFEELEIVGPFGRAVTTAEMLGWTIHPKELECYCRDCNFPDPNLEGLDFLCD